MSDTPTDLWEKGLAELLLRIGGRFARVESRRRMRDYVRGLLGPVGRKNGWQLAEYAGHATPDGLQHLLSRSRWEADEVRDDLHAYVAEHLGADNGVLIIDDTGFVKKGTTSAGVQRQYSGTAGRTENCQIGVFAAYATFRGHTLVDRELYLPKSWTEDRERCRAARVPDDRVFATKGELARAIILRALASPLPIGWVTADSAYGQDSHFRRFLEDHQLSYVVAVPKSQQVHGPRIDHLIGQAPPEAWQRLSAGSGAKGERFYDWAAARLPAVWEFDGDEPTRQRWMLARRSIAKPDEIAYYLASAPLEATVADLARIAGCRWKVEECFQSAKNECGLDQYEVRRYVGWYRHITLAMLAHAFLAVLAGQEREKGEPSGTHPTSWTSHRPRFDVCWQLDPAAVLRTATTR
ncbi:IS701 family transposase [Streptomyces atratus]|uniref:SRSO17 transposase n=1 Tax=Streptomyces atratus TaxID=1893 RepID=A0A1K1XYA0_STRAR|nr:IS701 family transposase [Streptomyces atratus]SFX54470.1 SRSO17 transposase [Streptomyces atratus]